MTYQDGLRVTAMLPAYTALEVRIFGAPLSNGNLHQLTHTIAVNGGKRIFRQNTVSDVVYQKACFRIIPRNPICRLGEVVGSE